MLNILFLPAANIFPQVRGKKEISKQSSAKVSSTQQKSSSKLYLANLFDQNINRNQSMYCSIKHFIRIICMSLANIYIT